ncbi:histidine phosphatase superfamily [Podospora didyma]|uniref:Histidine phosphatase superfamily n=1 Tax=Podospora didyma TaxID=330526 RepID=A0AAE0NGX2_9PEZI|nr:histidine phosphatase superfamily [Podospora didyma]
MPTTYVTLVRHAQGFHNLTTINQQIPDPDLTPLGRQQCADLCAAFPHHEKITHLVSSPMRRTLYTCLLSFAPAAAAGKVITALPEIQEVSNLPCDIGSSPKRLAAEFEPEVVDLSRLTPDWTDKGPDSPWQPDMAKLEARSQAARRYLRDLGAKHAAETGGKEDAHIVAVTHGGILHFLAQDFDGMNFQYGTGWHNTEYRTYVFADPSGLDPEARLHETKASWRRRRSSSAAGLTETEQRELRAAVSSKIKEEFGGPTAKPAAE